MEDDNIESESPWAYMYYLCAEPTLTEGLRFSKDLIIANLLLRFIIQVIKSLPHHSRHSSSFIIGAFLMYESIGDAMVWTGILAAGSYILIVILYYTTKKLRGIVTCLSVISFLLFSELYIVNPKMWHQIRGIQMIAAMKVISVAIDLDRDLFKRMLNPLEFAGYVFCPANSILGPWISYHTYNQYLHVRFLYRRWIQIIAVNLFLSMLFLVLSNCFVPFYISDDTTKWFVAYRDAQAFRMSHYFISSLSVVSMVCAGFGLTNDCHCELQVTKPFFIELPRSLVQVVIYWNIPMHQWLKNYVFKTCQPYSQFIAILVTYAISSLLHGLNFQLSAVLLSIGTFSYIEYNFRHKVASALEVCCLANPCGKQCDHKHKKNSFLAILLNTIFSFIAVVHLAYLGVMFEASASMQESGFSYSHTISKWENLNFFSHGLAAFMFIINLMM